MMDSCNPLKSRSDNLRAQSPIWHSTVDLLAAVSHCKSALITQLCQNRLEVVAAAGNAQNEIKIGDSFGLDADLFCMRVVQSRSPLFVRNETNEQEISYFGYPLLHPDGSMFGTLCVMEARPPLDVERFRISLQHCRQTIENHLTQAFQLRKLNLAARTDLLTGIYNRRGFFEQAPAKLALLAEQNRCAGLVFIDIDRLKPVNDQFGHTIGDHVIAGIAKLVHQTLDAEDLVARYAGDEFVAIVSAYDAASLLTKVEYLRCKLSGTETVHDIPLSASVGFERIDPANPDSLGSIIDRADADMYQRRGSARFG